MSASLDTLTLGPPFPVALVSHILPCHQPNTASSRLATAASTSLVCVLLKRNRVFTIDVPVTKKAGILRDPIKAKLSVGCAADLLTLYSRR